MKPRKFLLKTLPDWQARLSATSGMHAHKPGTLFPPPLQVSPSQETSSHAPGLGFHEPARDISTRQNPCPGAWDFVSSGRNPCPHPWDPISGVVAQGLRLRARVFKQIKPMPAPIGFDFMRWKHWSSPAVLNFHTSGIAKLKRLFRFQFHSKEFPAPFATDHPPCLLIHPLPCSQNFAIITSSPAANTSSPAGARSLLKLPSPK